MTSPTPFNRNISRHIWETRYRAEGETDIQTTWQRVAHALALKGCTVFRPNAIADTILSPSLASPQVRCCGLEHESSLHACVKQCALVSRNRHTEICNALIHIQKYHLTDLKFDSGFPLADSSRHSGNFASGLIQ